MGKASIDSHRHVKPLSITRISSSPVRPRRTATRTLSPSYLTLLNATLQHLQASLPSALKLCLSSGYTHKTTKLNTPPYSRPTTLPMLAILGTSAFYFGLKARTITAQQQRLSEGQQKSYEVSTQRSGGGI